MRKLYLIPIIHMSADMGSLAASLDKTSSAALSPELWQIHRQTIAGFWDSIRRFFDSLNVSGFKVYQDGLVADGVDGQRIVREAISQGSKNFEIIGDLLTRGAVLLRTEELFLVKQEYSYISKIASAKSWQERGTAAIRYKLAGERLLKQRDQFICRRIDETLGSRQTGALFIGAYHQITPNLPTTIMVIPVKEVARVKEYHIALTTKKRYDQQIQRLSEYLISAVAVT